MYVCVKVTVSVLLSSKLSLQEDLEILVPRYFLSERSKESQELKTMVYDIVKRVKDKDDEVK